LAQGEDPDGDAATSDVMRRCKNFRRCVHTRGAFSGLEQLAARRYSISSRYTMPTPGKLSLDG